MGKTGSRLIGAVLPLFPVSPLPPALPNVLLPKKLLQLERVDETATQRLTTCAR
jgi:hypothetical protein